jgi:hypothetical protein
MAPNTDVSVSCYELGSTDTDDQHGGNAAPAPRLLFWKHPDPDVALMTVLFTNRRLISKDLAAQLLRGITDGMAARIRDARSANSSNASRGSNGMGGAPPSLSKHVTVDVKARVRQVPHIMAEQLTTDLPSQPQWICCLLAADRTDTNPDAVLSFSTNEVYQPNLVAPGARWMAGDVEGEERKTGMSAGGAGGAGGACAKAEGEAVGAGAIGSEEEDGRGGQDMGGDLDLGNIAELCEAAGRLAAVIGSVNGMGDAMAPSEDSGGRREQRGELEEPFYSSELQLGVGVGGEQGAASVGGGGGLGPGPRIDVVVFTLGFLTVVIPSGLGLGRGGVKLGLDNIAARVKPRMAMLRDFIVHIGGAKRVGRRPG